MSISKFTNNTLPKRGALAVHISPLVSQGCSGKNALMGLIGGYKFDDWFVIN